MPNYSSISDGRAAASTTASSTSGEMTMSRTRSRRGNQKDAAHNGQATTISSVVNLLNTIVGAGTLAMPSALSHFGVVMGVLVIVWSGFTSAFGLYLQSRCARYLDRGSASFFALSQLTYPNAAVIFDAAIAIKCFGVGISYMIIIGDLMPGVVLGFDSRAENVSFLMDRNFWITAFMLVIIPLAFLRRLDSLKYTSVIPYLIAALFGQLHGEGPITALSSLPVVIFAYTCHQNMFSILNELKDSSPRSIMGVISSSIGSAASIYVLVALTGYFTFGDNIKGNIVSMYAPSVASTIAKAAIVVLVTFSIPLQVHPCRASVDAVLKWRPNKSSKSNRATSPGGRPLLPTIQRSDHGPGAPMSDLRFALLTTAILVLSYCVALSMKSLERVLAYVGSTGSTSISFILPGLFYYKISDPDSVHHQRLAKEDDDADTPVLDDESDEENVLSQSTGSLHGGPGGSKASQMLWQWRRKFRWDMEHINPVHLRRAALALAIYGFIVMGTCLVLNMFVSVAH
ncbi:AVT6-involved in amino acid efflux from the vacuole [Apiospora arundinis]